MVLTNRTPEAAAVTIPILFCKRTAVSSLLLLPRRRQKKNPRRPLGDLGSRCRWLTHPKIGLGFIEVNGVGLRWELAGGGGERTVVLIHVTGGSLESWDEAAARHAAREPQALRRVLRHGTRGAGSRRW